MEALASMEAGAVRVHLLLALLVSEEIADLDLHGQDGEGASIQNSGYQNGDLQDVGCRQAEPRKLGLL